VHVALLEKALSGGIERPVTHKIGMTSGRPAASSRLEKENLRC
jgi:hypothetical protein